MHAFVEVGETMWDTQAAAELGGSPLLLFFSLNISCSLFFLLLLIIIIKIFASLFWHASNNTRITWINDT